MDMINITISAAAAATLLEMLERRMEVVEGVERLCGQAVSPDLTREKETIASIGVTLREALNAPARNDPRRVSPPLSRGRAFEPR